MPKTVLVTGGAGGIGKAIVSAFRAQGDIVCPIDIAQNDFFVGDVANPQALADYVEKVVSLHGKIDCIVNNAPPIMRGIDSCSYEQFMQALSVGVAAPFMLVKLALPHLSENASIVNISSLRDKMSQPQTESYSAAKGGISALTHSLAVSLRGRARVNAISPGWIDVNYTEYSGADATQQPVGRVGNPDDIAQMVLYLCSDKAKFISGQNIYIDGGMSAQLIYHNDCGWSFEEQL